MTLDLIRLHQQYSDLRTSPGDNQNERLSRLNEYFRSLIVEAKLSTNTNDDLAGTAIDAANIIVMRLKTPIKNLTMDAPRFRKFANELHAYCIQPF